MSSANYKILEGDCVEIMASMEGNSVDAIVTDPPYGLSFMGKEFDKLGEAKAQQLWHEAWAREALRVLKPIALMRYLCKMITPPNGTVLDPFCGSGSTGCAAVLEGFDFIGIEKEAEYAEIARRRIAHWSEAEPKKNGKAKTVKLDSTHQEYTETLFP